MSSVRSWPAATASSACSLIERRASAKRVVTVRDESCQVASDLRPCARRPRPASARVNSRSMLSTCALAASSSAVGTSPSAILTAQPRRAGRPGGPAMLRASRRRRCRCAPRRRGRPRVDVERRRTCLELGPDHLAAGDRANPPAAVRPRRRGTGHGRSWSRGRTSDRTGATRDPSCSSIEHGRPRRRPRRAGIGGAPCITALLVSSVTTVSASATTTGSDVPARTLGDEVAGGRDRGRRRVEPTGVLHRSECALRRRFRSGVRGVRSVPR